MRLPRRVPWASVGELDQLCSWIYSDENDLEAKQLAIRRLSAWKAITSLPHALESTLSLLSVIVQDATPQPQDRDVLCIRQSYAAALIRLVNGLVDPLQLGAYARSIASIASQLGLPPWLVELRHAATHEDLPSLEVLREASGESMTWLLHNYFLPTLNPASTVSTTTPILSPIQPILSQYKTLLKTVTRDASLKSRYKADITKVMRDVERWIAETKVAANVLMGEFGSWSRADEEDDAGKEGEQDYRERWALEKFCDALLDKGGLVPVSKKKRGFSKTDFYPPPTSLPLWTPLIEHVTAVHPNFPAMLVYRVILYVATPDMSSEDVSFASAFTRDQTYLMCLVRWAMWALEKYGAGVDNVDFQGESDMSDTSLRREDVLVQLMAAMCPGVDRNENAMEPIRAFAKALCSGDARLEQTLQTLLPVAQSRPVPSEDWQDSDMSTISGRLNGFLAQIETHNQTASEATSSGDPQMESSPNVVGLPAGWKLLSARDEWRPCPIGVYISEGIMQGPS